MHLVQPRCKLTGMDPVWIFSIMQANSRIGSAKSDLPGFNLILDVAHVLPLVFKDIPFGMFNASNDLMFSKLSLTIYGFYAHSDVQSVIASWREGNVCDTAKLCLQEGGITNRHKERWHTLHQELFRNQLVGSKLSTLGLG